MDNIYSNRAGYHKKIWDYREAYTFIPNPACDINIKIDNELCRLLSNAHRSIGLLEGSCRHIYNIENFTRYMLMQEAYTSCKIDDEVSFSHLELFIPPKYRKHHVKPIQNYIDAMNLGLEELKSIRLANKVIFSVHKILMAHKDGDEIVGSPRKTRNLIIGNNFNINLMNQPSYRKPEYEELNLCITDIQNFIEKEDASDLLIKTALLHYQLEVVNPFESGNGKVGRILIALYLFDRSILKHTILPISEFFESNKVEYHDRIKAVHEHGHYEQWVKFFLKAIISTVDSCLQRIDNFIQYRKKSINMFEACRKDSKYLMDSLCYMEKNTFLSVDSLADGIEVSYNTAARIANILIEMNVIKLLKDQTRNRIYFCSDLLEAMGFNIDV